MNSFIKVFESIMLLLFYITFISIEVTP